MLRSPACIQDTDRSSSLPKDSERPALRGQEQSPPCGRTKFPAAPATPDSVSRPKGNENRQEQQDRHSFYGPTPPSRTSPVSSGFPTLSMSETPSDARQPADAPPPNPHPSTNAPDRQSDNRASSHKTKSVEDPLRLPAGRVISYHSRPFVSAFMHAASRQAEVFPTGRPARGSACRIAEMSDERHHRPASGRTRLQNPPEASAVPPGNDCGGPVKGRRISYGRRIAYFR